MSWEDHVVECKNKNGKIGKFVFPHHCPPKVSSYKYTGLPYSGPKLDDYYVGQQKVWQHNGLALSNKWSFTRLEILKEKGWDLRPLEMHEDKPYPEAILAYNEEKDIYGWFLHQSHAPNRWDSGKRPYRANKKGFYSEHYWQVSKGQYFHTWSCKESWENPGNEFGGWKFLENETREAKVTETALELQEKLIKYCAEKASRTSHLIKLTELGTLNTDQTYEECAKKITDYLKSDQSVCPEGQDRALKALRLKVEKNHLYKYKLEITFCSTDEHGTVWQHSTLNEFVDLFDALDDSRDLDEIQAESIKLVRI